MATISTNAVTVDYVTPNYETKAFELGAVTSDKIPQNYSTLSVRQTAGHVAITFDNVQRNYSTRSFRWDVLTSDSILQNYTFLKGGNSIEKVLFYDQQAVTLLRRSVTEAKVLTKLYSKAYITNVTSKTVKIKFGIW